MPLRLGSLFSGIGGFDLAAEQAGLTVAWQVELNPQASAVLAHHWPEVPRHGDITTLDPGQLAPVDIICGGSPCQDLSLAGNRHGLAGQQSRLFWDFVRIADAFPRAPVVWENVPGVLSAYAGRDFALVLWGFTGFLPGVPAGGWRSAGVCTGPKRTVAWRVLDAQYFGVAQRRRRVIVVGYPGHDPRAVQVLFDAESVSRRPAPRRPAQTDAAARAAGRPGNDRVAGTLMASGAGTNRPAGMASEVDFLVTAATLTTGSAANPGVNAPGRRQEDDVNLVVGALTQARGGADDNHAQAGWLIPVPPSTRLKREARPDTAREPHAIGFSLGSDPIVCDECMPPLTGRHGDPSHVARTLLAHPGSRYDGESETLVPVIVPPRRPEEDAPAAFDLAQITSAANRSRVAPGLPDPTLHAGGGAHVIARTAAACAEDGTGVPSVAHTLRAEGADASEDGTGRGTPLVVSPAMAVRRLMPLETERLQGFPDDWTWRRLRRRRISDSARYRMIGNAVAVPVVLWIFRRIVAAVDWRSTNDGP